MKKIVYIEDEPDLRMLVALALESIAGYKVDAFGSGAEGLASLADGFPDLLLLDLMLPGMDGAEILANFKELPGAGATPVMFISARDEARLRGLAEDEQVVGIIKKPFDPEGLVETIQAYFEKELSSG